MSERDDAQKVMRYDAERIVDEVIQERVDKAIYQLIGKRVKEATESLYDYVDNVVADIKTPNSPRGEVRYFGGSLIHNRQDASSIDFSEPGTGAIATDLLTLLHKGWVFADGYSGASVSAQIDAAIAAASGRVVIIPHGMGAGEGTTYGTGVSVLDLRAPGVGLGSGGKIMFGFSDSGGHERLLVIDDVTSPTLAGNAAALFNHRPTGALPSNSTGDGLQGTAQSTGTLTSVGVGYVLSGIEATVNVASNGQTITDAYGLTANSETGASSTTNVTNLVSVYAQAPAKNGTGTITNSYSIVAETPVAGGTENYSIWSKGPIKVGGDISLNRNGASSNSSLLSGNASNYYFLDIGRAGGELRLAVSNGASAFVTGDAAGDAIVGTPGGGGTLWLMGVGTGVAKISGTAVGLQVPFHPSADSGAFQTAAALYAGFGVPSNTNGINGDFYFRSDGGAGTAIYQKRAGSWSGIV